MADDAKADEMTHTLRESFAASIRSGVPELPAHHALQLADVLCTVQMDVLAGLRVTYRARPEVDGDAIAEDWRRGMLIGEIVGKHKVSRPTAYKFHPSKKTRHIKGA